MKISRRRTMHLFAASAMSLAAPGFAAAQGMAKAQAALADVMFNEPYVDVDEWRDAPARHRYVHGGFKGTDAKFAFYFPPKAEYGGRFFHYISPVPVAETEVLKGFGAHDALPFAFDSGAYAVGTNQGGAGATGSPLNHVDPSIAAYRVSAASAEYSRILAAQMYGPHRTYGYVFGGSGGAYRTIGAFENTTTWDGAVPFVMGSPMAIPNVYTVRSYALRVLKDRFPQIIDAIEPGGSGDMYAGLNAEERAALLEVTRMGLPPRAWTLNRQGDIGLGAYAILFDLLQMSDPAYFKEFWTTPGYLGADPPASLTAARVQAPTTVVRIVMSDQAAAMGVKAPSMGGPAAADADSAWKTMQRQMGGVFPVALQLKTFPATGDLRRAAIRITSGAAAGKTLSCGGFQGDYALLAVSPLAPSSKSALSLQPGDQVLIDNSNYLAAQTYHRHQVPADRDYHVWDQFRRPDGAPLYPQRPRLIGPEFTKAASGVLPSARFKGKMIVVECLMDYDAFPWQADWYRCKVRETIGAGYEDLYRLWFIDHAIHSDTPPGGAATTRVISYTGVLQQALRDLSAWVERGVSAPATTDYTMVDGQVVVPPTAAGRRGVQAVVVAKANGADRAHAKVGEPVSFTAVIEVPPGMGGVVSADWDFEGDGSFPVASPLPDHAGERAVVHATYAFSKPGTYFPALKVASQRQGDAKTPFARIPNLGRVRVVVS